MLKFMLDTNICILTIKDRPQEVRSAFKRHQGQMCISSVTLMELIYGTEKSSSPERNLAVMEGFAARLEVLNYGWEAAAHYWTASCQLSRAGTHIGPYDQMIAGHARSAGLLIVTNNQREFHRVPGVRVEDWVARPE